MGVVPHFQFLVMFLNLGTLLYQERKEAAYSESSEKR